MNKATKIRVNYAIASVITVILLTVIYFQIKTQLADYDFKALYREGANEYFFTAVLLLPVNIGIEMYKWKLLAGSAQPVSYAMAAKSFLAGLALSILTPNRIGEYPGRILYLKQRNTPRLISVTFLGIFTQFLCLFLFGIPGLLYYNIALPGYWQKSALVIAILCAIALAVVFFRFEKWSGLIERFSFLKKFKTYSRLLKKFTLKEQLLILGLSMLRFCTYVIQYLLLLRWLHIELPLLAGFCLACLFFFSMAVVPSVAFAEIGIRGGISLFLFQNFSTNKIGILVATLVLWLVNLILPALIGSVLWIKIRLIK